MRILLISYEYPPLGGGGGVAVAHYAHAWACKGHSVAIVTSGLAGLLPYERDGALEIYRLPVPWRVAQMTASLPSLLAFPPLAVRFAQNQWTADDFDIIHSCFAIPSGVAGLLLARCWRRPHVVTLMGGDVLDPSKRLSPHRTPLLKQTVATVLRNATIVIALSTDLARHAERIYGLSREVIIIPLGLELSASGKRPFTKSPVNVVAIARLVRRKLLNRLIEACAALSGELIRLTIVGDGPERSPLEQLITTLGMEDRIELSGYISDAEKQAVLCNADIFALVSEHEGFGLVYLEAASQGLPIVAGTVGGHLDFLKHGQTGWLVPPNDVLYLAQALGTLATQPALRHWMGQQAFKVAQQYEIAHVADVYIEVFHDAQNDSK